MWHIYTMEYPSAIKRNKIGSYLETTDGTWEAQPGHGSDLNVHKQKNA